MKITAIILVFNEAMHIERCIKSLRGVADVILVVDCYSTDHTVAIARGLGARVLQHPWTNHATQFNWALSQLQDDTEWVLRIDADEYLTAPLITEIRKKKDRIGCAVNGIYMSRRMKFQGRLIKYGGVFPVRVLRLFRWGHGQCEDRWMDEHIKVSGPTADFKGEIIDDNLNTLTWWIDKHNNYASREAIDLLNLELKFMPRSTIADLRRGNEDGVKRWLKEEVYARLPGGVRAFAYFFYRYILRFGFLDGKEGAYFHILQAFWYRFLVDAKVNEVRQYIHNEGVEPQSAIKRVLDIEIHS
jgi:glycosyltransferase involved in cell wall biosynthesis